METLLSEYGKVLKIIQYIEHNLTLIIRYKVVLNLFDENDIVPTDVFEETDELAIEISEKFYNKTLGNLVSYIKDYNFLNNFELETLEYILNKRNYFVHHYFKENDFEKHYDNYDFIDNQTRRLKNLLTRADNFNYKLCEIIDKLKIEYGAIEDVA
ncbi:hypothetical protein RI065_10120 [Mycoplasmatota bacterium zrk1]